MNVVPTQARKVEARREGAVASLAQELGPALAQGLDLPLSALRASVEALREVLAQDPAGRQVAANVLQQVGHLTRNVRDLVDYTTPPEPRPSRCTASEIVLSARRALPEDARARVTVARERTDAILCIDAPLVVMSLLRLLERAVDEGSTEILLFVRHEESCAVFGVIDAAPRRAPGMRRGSSDLSLAVVRRDLELLDGSLELRRSPHGETCARVTLPVQRNDLPPQDPS